MTRLRAAAAVLAVFAGMLAVPAVASACNGWTEPGMESQLMCIVCHERLDQSTSAFSTRVRHHLEGWCRAGWPADRVRGTLVAQFGEEILAAPPKRGFDLLAWVVPGFVLAGGAVVAAALAATWSRRRRGPPATEPAAAIDPELAARIDADLRRFE